jgi:hypothetical protein
MTLAVFLAFCLLLLLLFFKYLQNLRNLPFGGKFILKATSMFEFGTARRPTLKIKI